MSRHEKILELITEIANSNPIMQDIFLAGSCCNFHYILKSVFPDAKAEFNIDHVVTKIDGKYYDITGEIEITEVIEKGYMPIDSIYPDKYKTDESIKAGEMYNPNDKTKYLRDIRNWGGFVSKCHESELITMSADEGTGYYVCKECGQPCDVT